MLSVWTEGECAPYKGLSATHGAIPNSRGLTVEGLSYLEVCFDDVTPHLGIEHAEDETEDFVSAEHGKKANHLVGNVRVGRSRVSTRRPLGGGGGVQAEMHNLLCCRKQYNNRKAKRKYGQNL